MLLFKHNCFILMRYTFSLPIIFRNCSNWIHSKSLSFFIMLLHWTTQKKRKKKQIYCFCLYISSFCTENMDGWARTSIHVGSHFHMQFRTKFFFVKMKSAIYRCVWCSLAYLACIFFFQNHSHHIHTRQLNSSEWTKY